MKGDGEVYFMWLSTHGRGMIPHLPSDMRQYIYSRTFPRVRKTCAYCGNPVLVEVLGHKYVEVRQYTLVDNVCVCMKCKTIQRLPPVVPRARHSRQMIRLYTKWVAFFCEKVLLAFRFGGTQ